MRVIEYDIQPSNGYDNDRAFINLRSEECRLPIGLGIWGQRQNVPPATPFIEGNISFSDPLGRTNQQTNMSSDMDDRTRSAEYYQLIRSSLARGSGSSSPRSPFSFPYPD